MKARFPIPRPSQRGISMVELLVGLTISLVISLGLFMMVAGTSNAFKVQDDFARLQENGASALRYLVDDIRMAGFYGNGASVASVNLDSLPVIAADNDCGAVVAGPPARPFALDLATPFAVRSDLTPDTVSGVFPCIAKANFYPDSLVIVLRGATGTAAAALDGNTLYVQSNPSQDPNTILFRGDSFAAMKTAVQTRSFSNGDDAPIFAYQTHVYYIRPCSRPTGGLPAKPLCQGSDDGGRPVPTLVRQELANQKMQETALIEGVERLNMLYGIDSDNDGVADQFTAAPADPTQVVGGRIFVLVRTDATASGYSDAAKSYDLGGGMTFNCTLQAAPCNVRRHVFSKITSVRNCAQRRGGGGFTSC